MAINHGNGRRSRWAAPDVLVIVLMLGIAAFVASPYGSHAIATSEPADGDKLVFAVAEHKSVNAWEESSIGDRVEMMQFVADAEAAYLGVTPAPFVQTEHGMDAVACYRAVPGTITFDADQLMSMKRDEAVAACLHEVWHAYEHHVVWGIVPEPEDGVRDSWAYNLDHYVSPKDDMGLYWCQPVELSARNHSKERLAVYTAAMDAGA